MSDVQHYIHPLDFWSRSKFLIAINNNPDDFDTLPKTIFVFSLVKNMWYSVRLQNGKYMEHALPVHQLSPYCQQVEYKGSKWGSTVGTTTDPIDDGKDNNVAPMLEDSNVQFDDDFWTRLQSDNDVWTQLPLDKTFWTRYAMLDILGSGSSGIVIKIQNKQNQHIYALKLLQYVSAREIFILLYLSHRRCPNSDIKIFKVPNHSKIQRLGAFAGQWIPAIRMEFVPGDDMHTMMSTFHPHPSLQYQPPPAAFVHSLLFAVAVQLQHLHMHHGIVHRDIKPDNIMVHGKEVRIIDFGLSCIAREDSHRLGVCDGYLPSGGTSKYMSPELLLSYRCAHVPLPNTHGRVTARAFKSDVFSLGATFYTFVTGNDVYALTQYPSLLTFGQYMTQLANKSAEEFYPVNMELQELIRTMIHPDVDRRPSVAAIIHQCSTINAREQMTSSYNSAQTSVIR